MLPEALGRSRCIVGHSVRALLSIAVLCSLTVCGACAQEQGGVAPTSARAGEPATLADRSQDVLDLFANADEPGCSAAVAQQGEVVWRGVQGLADLASKTPITTSTVCDIGSVSKQFTAAAILLLRDAGKLNWTTSLLLTCPSSRRGPGRRPSLI